MPRTKKTKKTKQSKTSKSLSSNIFDFFNNSQYSKKKSTLKSQSSHSTHSTHSTNSKTINETLSSFYTFNNPINTTLIKYTDSESKIKIKNSINNIKLVESYEFPLIIENFKRLDKIYIEEKKLMKELKLKKLPSHIKYATEDLTRGLRAYINDRYNNLPKNVSNAFVKLWEVFEKFDIMPSQSKSMSKSFRTFHIAEAPGMMTQCSQYFAKTKRPDITDYDWRANSLNPYNNEAQKKGALRDDYGLIKSNPKKWLWGADNTGDITNTKNIKSFNNYINKQWLHSNSSNHNHTKLDLITGDAGTDPHIDTILLQKLDLAQAITVVACSHIGGNACVKHFSSYITSNPESIEATSFFISFIYLYYICFKEVSLYKPYTSNGDSGEFYIVCKDFIGIDNQQKEKLYKCLDTFKTNYAIFPEDSIPETFILQVNSFISLLCNLNIQAIEKTILLLNCYKDSKSSKEDKSKSKSNNKSKNITINSYCDNLLNDNKLDNILIPRFNQWIKNFNFE